LLYNIYRATGNSGDLTKAANIKNWIDKISAAKQPRSDLYISIKKILYDLQSSRFSGSPKNDWSSVRDLLRNSKSRDLIMIDDHLSYLMTFNRGKKIEKGLSESWTENGCYRHARTLLDLALTEDQIYGGLESTSGIHVMTMHKSKGKQFDATIIYRSEFQSPFKWPRDADPFYKSRKVLRVAITRAKSHVIILNEATSSCPILSKFHLDSPYGGA
jgi:DNA helicase II / ATP-dependent DNA helicase PcrA